ncbi:MAG: asparagine synthase (glutamine-hydrolyzing) [Cytophagales bacterium]|nr:asparagine synthase (glutamine-hydrolyzing) [Cytophagales bacterium]
MCGISGIFSTNGKPISLADLQSMHHAIAHRGADDEGFTLFAPDVFHCYGGSTTPPTVWESKYAYAPQMHIKNAQNEYYYALAHRRLSIIDTSAAGHQPMCTPDGRYWIAYNGEIYNYVEIRHQLTQQGVTFDTQSDTEVLLKGYMTYGIEILQKLNGMWAFCIYDHVKKTALLARDRTGLKPLYIYNNSQYIYFSSEIKSITTIQNFDKKINNNAILNYLIFAETEKNNQCIFYNIKEINSSEYLYIDIKKNEIIQKKYYTFQQISVNCDTQILREKIEDSVKIRMRSDVPVACTLSGGIDSTSIASIMSKHASTGLYTFSSVLNNSTLSEKKWIDIASSQIKCTPIYDEVKPTDIAHHLEKFVYDLDIPVMNLNTYMHYSLMKSVSTKGIKVVLEGQGADELFAGYYHYFYIYFLYKIYNNEYENLLKNVKINLIFFNIIKQIVYKYSSNINYINQLKKRYKIYQFIKQDFINTTQNNNQFLQEIYNNPAEKLIFDYFGNTLKTMYRCADRNAMAHGVESRMPFADDLPLFEYALNIPWDFKIRDGVSKYCLREAMKPYLPHSIYARKDKVGFVSNQTAWLQEMRPILKPYINESLSEYIDYKSLIKNWDAIFEEAHKNSNPLWRVVNLAVWLKVMNINT